MLQIAWPDTYIVVKLKLLCNNVVAIMSDAVQWYFCIKSVTQGVSMMSLIQYFEKSLE